MEPTSDANHDAKTMIMSKQEALSKGWQPTANFYAGSQIWKNGDKKGLYSPCLDLLTVIG